MKTKCNYNDSKKYSKDIINVVSKILDDNEIEYVLKSDRTEIVISNKDSTKSSIEQTIYDNIDIPKLVFIVLIDIVEVDNYIYIRQKTK